MNSPILFGTSGWNQEPRGTRPSIHALEHLAADFDAVEISSARDVMLKPEIVNVWIRKVNRNPRFRFSVALHRSFTEDRQLDRDSIQQFAEGVRPMQRAGRLGCVLMQFPWSFRFTGENRKFLIELRRTFSAYPLVAEMRHSSWLHDDAIGTFLDYNVGFCNVDQTPQVHSMPATNFLTSSIGYVRLCRQRRDEYGRWQPAYDDETYAEWKSRIEKVSRFSQATFVVASMSDQRVAERCVAKIQAMLDSSRPVPARPVTSQGSLFQELGRTEDAA